MTNSDSLSPLEPTTGFIPHATTESHAAEDLRAAAAEKIATLGHCASDLKERALEKAHQFRDLTAEKAEELKHTAEEKAQHLRHLAEHQWHETRDRARDWHHSGEEYVRENPTKAVVGALAIGFIIGLIVRR